MSDVQRGSDDVLRSSAFSRSTTPGFDIEAPDAQAILRSLDASNLHPLAASLNKGELDYLVLDDGRLNQLEGAASVLPSRGWSDELCYGTGTTYLSGLAAGGLWGVYEGFRRPLTRATPSASFTLASLNAPYKRAAEAAAAAAGGSAAAAASAVPPPGAASAPFAAAAPPPPMGQAAGTSSATAPPGASAGSAPAAAARASPTMKLRLNTILNSATARGTFLGNNAGVLALIYNAINCTIDRQRGRHDIVGSMSAGFLTGALWKSTAGPRAMAIAAGLCTAGAAGWTELKRYL